MVEAAKLKSFGIEMGIGDQKYMEERVRGWLDSTA